MQVIFENALLVDENWAFQVGIINTVLSSALELTQLEKLVSYNSLLDEYGTHLNLNAPGRNIQI